MTDHYKGNKFRFCVNNNFFSTNPRCKFCLGSILARLYLWILTNSSCVKILRICDYADPLCPVLVIFDSLYSGIWLLAFSVDTVVSSFSVTGKEIEEEVGHSAHSWILFVIWEVLYWTDGVFLSLELGSARRPETEHLRYEVTNKEAWNLNVSMNDNGVLYLRYQLFHLQFCGHI